MGMIKTLICSLFVSGRQDTLRRFFDNNDENFDIPQQKLFNTFMFWQRIIQFLFKYNLSHSRSTQGVYTLVNH